MSRIAAQDLRLAVGEEFELELSHAARHACMLFFGQKAIGGSGAYQVSYSARFQSANSCILTRTPGGASVRKAGTISVWVKRAELGREQMIFCAGSGTANLSSLRFTGSDELEFCDVASSSTRVDKITSARYRDPDAFMHVVAAWDTTVASPTISITVNGVAVTSFGTNTNTLAQNDLLTFGNTVAHRIGDFSYTSAALFSGYFSQFAVIDDSAVAATSFGEFDTALAWRPKNITGLSRGTNGFMFDFSNSSALGEDQGSGTNDFTSSGLTSGDQVTDTPTTNYATLNPLIPSAANISGGNLISGTTPARGTIDALQINSYWEVTAGGSNVTAGTIDAAGTTHTTTVTANKSFGFRLTTAGALDYINITDAGAWTSATTGLTGQQFPYSTTAAATWNFGQKTWTGSLPATYKALNTANLPTPAIKNGTQGFIRVKDTAANVLATLAAARAGWSGAYIEAFKDRDASASWVVRFSDDSGNYMRFDDTSAKTTFPAFSGSDVWSGYAFRVGAAYGIYTGTIAHTNGSDHSQAHGLVSPTSRYMGIVKIENTTGSWYMSHPDLTSGYNILIDTTANEQNSTVYCAVDGTNVTVKSSAPTGTYRVWVIAEIPGFSSLGVVTSNASVDGPLTNMGLTPAMVVSKSRTTSAGQTDWTVWDTAAVIGNPNASELNLDDPAAAGANAPSIDLLSNGMKWRLSGGINASGRSLIYFAFAERPFGGQNTTPATAR